MKIDFGFHQVQVDRRMLNSWFPQLSHTPWVDGNSLVDNLETHINGRYGIKELQIEQTLLKFFGKFGSHSGFFEQQVQMRVANFLSALLAKDMQNAWQSKGLRDSRHTFLVLAYLSVDYESSLLGEVLIWFWMRAKHSILGKESAKYIADWHKAAEKITELMEEPIAMSLGPLAMIPYAGLHRGRSPRALALPWAGHRARSLPAMRRRHNPDVRLAIPTYSSSTWASPMISPVRYPRNDYFEELDNIQYQQGEMNMKLNNVDGKLDLLLAGAYY
jgi:hypothetical protein